MPSNETYDVFQDSKGYLWIGTDNGVVKYDGHTFRTFTTKDGLTDNTIFRIQEDYKGRIWFMTYNRKLCYLEDGVFHEYKFNDELVESLKLIPISTIITDIQIDTLDNIDLFLFDLSVVSITNSGYISKKMRDRNQYLIFRVFESYRDIENAITEIENTFPVKKKEKKIIFYSMFRHHTHVIITPFAIYCSYEKGLHITLHDKSFSKSILGQFQITGVTHDFEGGIWCATRQKGIIYIPNPALAKFKLPIPSNKPIHGIVPQKDHLLFAYNVSDLFFISDKGSIYPFKGKVKHDKIPLKKLNSGIKLENIMSIENYVPPITTMVKIDSNRTLAYGYEYGFTILTNQNPENFPLTNGEYQQFKIYDTSIFQSPEKFLKTTFNPKLYSKPATYDPYDNHWYIFNERNYFQMISNPSIINRWLKKFKYKVTKLFKDSNGHIWVGTINGLYKFNPITEELTSISISDQITIRVQDIIESKDKELLIATKANGIYIKQKDSIIQLTTESGLISNTINQMTLDSIDNRIYCATNMGIDQLYNTKGNWNIKTVITKHDALKSTDIRQLRFLDDDLYFSSATNICKINRADLKRTLPIPFIKWTAFTVNKNAFSISEPISLSYDSNNIRISFEGISYKSQNDIHFKYQMIPLNEEWQSTTNSNLIFDGLSPDDYTLKIKAVNIDGVESQIKTLQFSIIPAFWMTWWFKSIIIIIAIFIGYRISITTINTYKNQAQLQHSLNEMQMISLQSKMNPHFIFNSLNSIQNYILKNEKKFANEYLLDFSKLIRTVLHNSNSSTIILQQEMDTLKMYVDLEKKRIRKDFVYRVSIDKEINQRDCIIPSLLIQPYIENSIWHGKVYSNPKGFIEINISLKNKTLFFTISDNGIGIKNAEASKIKKNQHESVGSAVTKKRIELLSELNNEMSEVSISELDSDQKTFKGTKVEFSIPYNLKPKDD